MPARSSCAASAHHVVGAQVVAAGAWVYPLSVDELTIDGVRETLAELLSNPDYTCDGQAHVL